MSCSPVVAKINSLLAEKGVSKQEFYSACGITSASYSLWKTGKTQPRMRNLETIADFLGVSVSVLVSGMSEEKEKPNPVEEVGPKKAELLEALEDMTAAEQALLLEHIQRIKSLRS